MRYLQFMFVAVALNRLACRRKLGALVRVKNATMSAKLAVKIQLLRLTLAAVTPMVVVVAVSRVKVGRRLPWPRPRISPPATSRARRSEEHTSELQSRVD